VTEAELALQECLQMEEVSWPLQSAPPEVAMLQLPCLQRQVYLQDPSPQRHRHGSNSNGCAVHDVSTPQTLVHAVSWWNLRKVRQCLKDTSKPIWASLSEERMELYREINSVYYGHAPGLEAAFGVAGPFWGRDYVFWHRGEPLTVIQEAFSSALSEHLGPMVCETG
jgi:chorismate lyase